MTTATVTVYLNDGPNRFDGFDPAGPLRLRPVTRFAVQIADHVPTEHITEGVLEIVFEQLNIDQPQHQWARAYRAGGYRSLSVGDVVVVGETAWACCPVGWRRLGTEQLHT
ncbi:hypothetical protein [Mycobacterium intracellulare]|uniref:hypothetical protein n=1 Tax=Mycobacterium intracellulare TaxID=1767 RepID=UPI0006CA742D|nr:hypothetical protein [Mycobacterium intracellulare]KPN46869.1 hypothetical protein AN933_25440 [Mycobacterium intracellulare subsp. chimaera]